jgi:hypothetical protein
MPDNTPPLEPGVPVEVRNRFTGQFAGGFEIAERIVEAPTVSKYRLRRITDGAILPAVFNQEDLMRRTRLG